MPEKKRGRGRPKVKDKVRVKYVYLTNQQEKSVLKKHKSLSNALITIALDG